MPWFFRKYLLRETMRVRLPEAIRTRPKTSLQEDPVVATLRRAKPVVKMQPAAQLKHYIDESRLPSLERNMDAHEAELTVRSVCLNFWLRSLARKMD